MLRGLDDVGWSELTHAYGEAVDTADLLRQAASPDREAAKEAVSELYGSIFHQGTVYPATVAAVPFLAELAGAATYGRADLVWLLGQLADPRHAYGHESAAVRAAVSAQSPALLTLLADADEDVREAAAYAAAQAGVDAESLWERWRAETSEPVQASFALALGLIDPAAAEPVLAELVVRSAPRVRLAAAVAMLRAGLTWPEGTIAEMVAAIDDGATVTYCWVHAGDWSDELMLAPSPPVALEVLSALLRAREPKTRELGLWAASQRCDASRSAPPRFVPLVAAVLDDPDPGVRDQAVDTLTRAGSAAGRCADQLAGLAAGFPETAGEGGFTIGYRAVDALARLGDPRWIAPVCAAAAAGHRPPRLVDGARSNPAVLAAIRDRLAAEPARGDVLAEVLGAWRAAEAVPDLLAALPYAGPQVAAALLKIGHDDPIVVPHLRVRAERSDDIDAALAIQRITGDAQPLLVILEAALSQGRRLPPGPRTLVGDLSDTLRPLLPAAREHLTGAAAPTHPQRETQILAARVIATVEGAQSVLPTVRAVLAGGHTPARAAADLVADLLPAHRDAVAGLDPLLRDRLHDKWSRVSAARALARLGVPTADLTEPLVHGVTDYAGRYGLTTILELRAVETIPGLERLAQGDHRLPATSHADRIVWTDELLTDQIHATIAALRTN
jgi:hypothetical protein